MGGAVSSGRDNSELIDNLVSSKYIRSRDVERVFRALDRADYMTRDARDQAYKDLAWRHGPLHLSAPCIYSEVMEGLELSPGLSFLNVGSGTGYLSTLVGLILGSGGISHGIEVNQYVFDYATKRLGQFIENSPVLDEFDFCEPKYFCGNGLCIAPLAASYDRVYCGAGCPEEYQNYFKQLIKVGGILVMPLNDNLLQVKRVGEAEWSSRSVLNVSFATLRVPTKDEPADLIRMDELCPVRLQSLCRGAVRALLRGGVWRRHPELRAPPPRPPPAKKPCPRRICIPIEDESDVEGLNALHDLDRGGGAGEMNALLSLVLSMGPSRVAGALRFDAPSDETLSDSEGPPAGPGQGTGSNSHSEGTDSPRADSSRSSRGSWGQRPCRGMLTFELRDQPRDSTQEEAVPSASGTQPATRSDEEASESRDAETSEKLDTATATHSDEADKPDTLDKDRSDVLDRGDVRGSHRSDEDRNDRDRRDRRDKDSRDRDTRERDTRERDTRERDTRDRDTRDRDTRERDTRDRDTRERDTRDRDTRDRDTRDRDTRDRSNTRDRSATRRRRDRDGNSDDDEQDDVPAEVEIYLGKMGGGEATTSRDMDWDADEEEEEEEEDDEPEEDAETERGELVPDTEPSRAADRPHRQKLDSGIGDMTPSVDSSPTSGYEAGSSRRSGPDSDLADSRPGRRRRQKRYHARRGSESGSSGASGTSGLSGASDTSGLSDTSGVSGARRRPKRRASDGGDARRVRLSILMKRSVKELPLPYALKKYVNLGRCFEF